MRRNRLRNRFLGGALAVALGVLLAPGVPLAQPGYGHGPHGRRGGGGGPMMMERLFDRLDLTADQRDQIHELFAKHRDELGPLLDQSQAAHQALADQIHADTFDEKAIRKAAADLAGTEADLAVARGRFFQDISRILTPEQRDQLRDMMANARQRREEFRSRRFGQGDGPNPWTE
jgi:Spy/CpxP family protein refolding chaperone